MTFFSLFWKATRNNNLNILVCRFVWFRCYRIDWLSLVWNLGNISVHWISSVARGLDSSIRKSNDVGSLHIALKHWNLIICGFISEQWEFELPLSQWSMIRTVKYFNLIFITLVLIEKCSSWLDNNYFLILYKMNMYVFFFYI